MLSFRLVIRLYIVSLMNFVGIQSLIVFNDFFTVWNFSINILIAYIFIRIITRQRFILVLRLLLNLLLLFLKISSFTLLKNIKIINIQMFLALNNHIFTFTSRILINNGIISRYISQTFFGNLLFIRNMVSYIKVIDL